MDPVLMRRLAKPLLFSAAFIWGTSFFIMKNTLDAVPVLWLLTFRFTTDAGELAYLDGQSWQVEHVGFVEEFFPEILLTEFDKNH